MAAAALDLTRLRVRSLDIDFNEISWEVAPTHVDVLDFTFQVLRSESPSGPFEPLGGTFEDRYVVIDGDLAVGNRWRVFHYLVRVTHKRTGATRDWGPVAREPEPDLIAMELRRHALLLMREFAGRECWVLPRRTFGQRCSCWDTTLRAPKHSGCRGCFGTGFARGYLSPIQSFMQIDPAAKTESVAASVATQQVNTSARCPYYPPLRPGDLIVEAENRRWRVISAAATEKGRAVVHQELTLHEIPPRDVEFDVPLDLTRALRDLFVSPERNFTNPHNLGADEDALSRALFSLYDPRQDP